ncbi:potassium channel family protein [Cellulosimicrobium marinum]|uniref:potassium channel family protein n=1 Tax=Cellulosimicrobium marinum TaxID=1638992 RepID=UPI001E44B524|nr:potassium channel family protein [Cellulosimicrobium marinum]MCB7138213.1 potassium channel family protein [Cellulosimicrobium marinum]
MRRLAHDSPWWTVLLTVGSMTACLTVYYGLPIPREESPALAQVLVFVGGLVLLGAVLTLQVRRQVRAGDEPSVRVQSVVGLLLPLVAFFAFTYYLMADQFVGIETRTDALYFAMVTLGTVGYGDVHPVGDAAKIVTMIQIVVDLVVVGVLVSVATGRARARAQLRAARPRPDVPEAHPEEP